MRTPRSFVGASPVPLSVRAFFRSSVRDPSNLCGIAFPIAAIGDPTSMRLAIPQEPSHRPAPASPTDEHQRGRTNQRQRSRTDQRQRGRTDERQRSRTDQRQRVAPMSASEVAPTSANEVALTSVSEVAPTSVSEIARALGMSHRPALKSVYAFVRIRLQSVRSRVRGAGAWKRHTGMPVLSRQGASATPLRICRAHEWKQQRCRRHISRRVRVVW